jgi:hypothetical protein
MVRLISLMFLLSCAEIKIHSTKKYPVSFNKEKNHSRNISMVVEKEFFIWGIYPKDQKLNLASEMKERGILTLSELRITEKARTPDVLWTIFSMGLYAPRTYVIEGKTTIK